MELSKYFRTAPMYYWTLSLLILMASVSSYYRGQLPTNLVISFLVASSLDMLMRKFFAKKPLSFPYSGAITGTIIGSIAPFVSSPLVVVTASIVAILSKYFIKIRGNHIFNPATLGLLVALSIFSLGDEWWAAGSYNTAGYIITLTPLLVIANYKAIKLGVSIPFLVTVALLSLVTGFIPLTLSISGIRGFFFALPFYFGFIMVSEPKTSPYKRNEQIVFGIAVAVLMFVLSFYNVKYALLLGLLACNLMYGIYRNLTKRI